MANSGDIPNNITLGASQAVRRNAANNGFEAFTPGAGSSGTVTSVSVTTANGVSGSVATATTTPAISLTLGAITPSSVNGVVLSGSATPTLAVTGTSSISGANTGDQTNISGNAATSTKTTNIIGGNATTLLGSVPYQSNTDTTTLLSPNTTTTKKFLRMTGDGTNGAVPAWDTVTAADAGAVAVNGAITGATKTKITYDTKGLVTSGADATTADIADSTNKRYVTDAQLTVIGNTSGTNTGDNTVATALTGTPSISVATVTTTGNIELGHASDTTISRVSAGLIAVEGVNLLRVGDVTSNATHTGDATGATALTVKGINGTLLSGLATGILKNTTTTGVPSIAVDGTDYFSSSQAIPAANIPNGISTLTTAIFSQAMAAGTYYYVTGSALTMPDSSKTGGGMSTSTTMQWMFMMSKTAAGTAAFNVCIYRGTNGSTADTRDVTKSIGTATAAVDIATVIVTLKVTATGATGSYTWGIAVQHKAATATGFGVTDATPFFTGTVSSVAMNTASLKFGIGLMGTTGTTTLVLSGLTGQVNNMT